MPSPSSIHATLVSPQTWATVYADEQDAEHQGFAARLAWTRTHMPILLRLSRYDVSHYLVVQGTEEADRIARWWAGYRYGGGASYQRLDWAQ